MRSTQKQNPADGWQKEQVHGSREPIAGMKSSMSPVKTSGGVIKGKKATSLTELQRPKLIVDAEQKHVSALSWGKQAWSPKQQTGDLPRI